MNACFDESCEESFSFKMSGKGTAGFRRRKDGKRLPHAPVSHQKKTPLRVIEAGFLLVEGNCRLTDMPAMRGISEGLEFGETKKK